MPDWLDDLLGALPFSLGRTLNTVFVAAVLSIGPAALLSGSGGSGAGFHEERFLVITVSAVVVAVIVVAVVSAWRGRERSDTARRVDGAVRGRGRGRSDAARPVDGASAGDRGARRADAADG